MSANHVLTLTQWFSPAFPVGAFAYSHGLEWAIEAGDVSDAASTRDWIETVLRHGSGWTDALLIGAAYHADDPREVDDIARALAASRERLNESVLQGEAFSATVAALTGGRAQALTYPVAVGHAARAADLPLELTAQVFLQAFASNLVSAAMRLVPLGQVEGQRLIRDLTPLCAKIAPMALRADLDDLSSTAFMTDLAAMKHETQYARVFRT